MTKDIPGMQRLISFRKKLGLSESQIIAAYKYTQAPAQHRLTPSLHSILRDVLVDGISIEQIEKRRGWAARSGKVVLGVILNALQEPDGVFTTFDPETQELRARASYLAADDPAEVMSVMTSYGTTQLEARVLIILRRSPNRQCSHEALQARLWEDDNSDRQSENLLKVLISKLRPKLKPYGLSIESVWGVGYRLVEKPCSEFETQTLDWYARHVHQGMSMNEIARQDGVAPSTVYRRITRAVDALDSDSAQDAYDARAKEHLKSQTTKRKKEQ